LPVFADELFYVWEAVGPAVEDFGALVKPWEHATGRMVSMPALTSDQFGQDRLWLAAGTRDINLFQTDMIWTPQLVDPFVDLTEAAKDIVPKHFPSIVQSQTVNCKPVALPIFTDAPTLYYRKDFLEKYSVAVPRTWADLTTAAQTIQDGERAAGKGDFWGFVWQGNACKGLANNAQESAKAFGGGHNFETTARFPSIMPWL
jgi:trehalose/maltose transport system substrate-binding protein